MNTSEISHNSTEQKYSQKVVISAEGLLKQYSLTFNDLTDKQKNIVCDYIQRYRYKKAYYIFLPLTSLFYVVMFILILKLNHNINLDFLIGCITGMFFVAMSIGVSFTFVYHTILQKQKKSLDAFLPAIKLTVNP